ncbi:MAG: GAF and ANTAR domain-containing protein [Nocardioidaceae bacterium]
MSEPDSTLRLPGAAGELPGVFQTLADLVYASDDFTAVYEAVCKAAPALITGCDHASLMLKEGDSFVTAAASDDVARTIDAIEREIGEGPCVDAIEEEGVFMDTDLTDGSPWPTLDRRVLADTPVRGMAGFRLAVKNRKTGALNLFSDTAGAMTQASLDEAVLLASFVSVALLAAHERETTATLRAGLQSNREIGKAVGLLMAFHKINDQEAFDLLRRASQDMNLKLAEVARQVVEHHNTRD